jgi:hypothetical protein
MLAVSQIALKRFVERILVVKLGGFKHLPPPRLLDRLRRFDTPCPVHLVERIATVTLLSTYQCFGVSEKYTLALQIDF